MNSRQADVLGRRLYDMLATGDDAGAYGVLQPILEQRTPFRILDRIASNCSPIEWPQTIAFLDRVAEDDLEGGWVIVGAFLRQQYVDEPRNALTECHRYIIAADKWYGADILAERVPGPALVQDFEPAQAFLAPWRTAENRWVRRAVGVAVHFWAKRSPGDEALANQAQELLDFLEPMFSEREMDAVKGVGWGLKTLGKYYPRQVEGWLVKQAGRPHRLLMLRKAITYLPDDSRQYILGVYGQ